MELDHDTRRQDCSLHGHKPGGEGGIRTRDAGSPHTRFPVVLLRPLGHLSANSFCRYSEPSLTTVQLGIPASRSPAKLIHRINFAPAHPLGHLSANSFCRYSEPSLTTVQLGTTDFAGKSAGDYRMRPGPATEGGGTVVAADGTGVFSLTAGFAAGSAFAGAGFMLPRCGVTARGLG